MSTLIDHYKQIYDCIHGFIWVSNYACHIINTPFFQRLKNLRQLGPCHYVYPTAIHSRFEHSIGTYYLADRLLKCIKERSDQNEISSWLNLIPELKSYYKRTYNNTTPLDNYVIELIKIAALCHDIGHGPFSHLFDDLFLQEIGIESSNKMSLHENRSMKIIEKVIKQSTFLKDIITDDEIKFIQNLINPPKKSFGFVYQIVSNKLNDLDVDKYDYIVRDTYHLNFKTGINYFRLVDDVKVINNIICYPEQIYQDIADIFRTRYTLHKQVYSHKAVLNIQFMILDLMITMDKFLNMSKSINNLDEFVHMTDEYIFTITDYLYNTMKPTDKNKDIIIHAKNIIDKLNYRNLYKNIAVIVTKQKLNIDQDYIHSLDPTLDVKNIIIHQVTMGFVSGDKNNPLDSIFFYNRKYPDKGCFSINKTDQTVFLTENYQEHVTMIFSKTKDPVILKKLRKITDVINGMKETLLN